MHQSSHELFHANDPWLSDSVQEELMAFQFAIRVARYYDPGTNYNPFKFASLNPYNEDDLNIAQQKLYDTG